MKFYFAGAIRGGRDRLDIYIKINKLLEQYGEVLDKHVASPNVDKIEENDPLEEIYKRDINWINECDLLVAEVSTPSLGVGYELSYAERIGKRVICIYDEKINISAMVGGNNYFEIITYSDSQNLFYKLDIILKSLK